MKTRPPFALPACATQGPNRRMYDEAVKEVRDALAEGKTVEIMTGPCAPLVIDSPGALNTYRTRLWAWLTKED